MAISKRIEETKRFTVDLSGETDGLSFYKLVKRHNSDEKLEVEVSFPTTEKAMIAYFGWKKISMGFIRDYMLQMRNYIAGENKQKLTDAQLMSDAIKFDPGYDINPVYWESMAGDSADPIKKAESAFDKMSDDQIKAFLKSKGIETV